METRETRSIEAGAWYRVSEVCNKGGRRGLVPVSRSWLYEQIALGRLKTRKIGQRATVVAGSDLLALLGEAA